MVVFCCMKMIKDDIGIYTCTYITCTLPQVYENAGYATQGALVTALPITTADRVCGMLGRYGSVLIVFPVTSYDCDSCW